MPSLKTVLVVDDNCINRAILKKMLTGTYLVLEAENGRAAMSLLEEHTEKIAAVMLDLVMPVMDGFMVLKAIRSNAFYSNLPIIVMTGNTNGDSEIKALTLGAWDFVSKPYNPEIIRFRLKNAIDRSQLSALKELQYLSEYDALTGIFNKGKFFAATRVMLDANCGEDFVFLRFDVDRFQLINAFFGTAEGDRLLIYIARGLDTEAGNCTKATFGRIESDIFGFCMPYDAEKVEQVIRHSKKSLAQYNPNYDIVPSIGIYRIEDPSIPVETMYNRAALAAKTCKGNYVDFYAYYNEQMSAVITAEQEITNEMTAALANGQFEIYLQPQYNIHTNLPCGAEALVRWNHPQKGRISPGAFIPVFERNGFITKLDYYVWEQVCQLLHQWKEQGLDPDPLSVNISRVNLYNPNLAEMLLELVERYQIEPALLNLELTESAYTDNPTAMKKTMTQLQHDGFTIMMDDFGSGYSSLSLLKDIAIDVLKIDMQFLSKTEIEGRGENIIASVIRMAKWLNIPVIAEGAETREQVDFLRSVGCDYVQGYYFARPMPVGDYEELCHSQPLGTESHTVKQVDNNRYNELFSLSHQMKQLFGNALRAAAIYEFVDDHIEMIRVNEAYYALLGHEDMLAKTAGILDLTEQSHREALLNAFRTCVQTREMTSCEYKRHRANAAPVWIETKLHYHSTVGNKHIVIGELTDITMRRELDSELQKYRTSLLENASGSHTLLIVDDVAINRMILKKILQENFRFLEAENGEQAIAVMQENPGKIDLILLDIAMPVMDGKAFLQYKKNRPAFDGIPVIMITADDSPAQQISTFSLGANDYIVKPFIPEVVTRRVTNVLESNQRFREMVAEYNTMSEQVKTDVMTGLLNRASAEKMIAQSLRNPAAKGAMLMLDIDHFKQFNDTRGHAYGDKVIEAVAERLKSTFRHGDIVARMGGDEFAVFLGNVSDRAAVELKADQLCRRISGVEIERESVEITCSIGIAFSSEETDSFDTLYQNADKALYDAKCRGRNTVSIFGMESVELAMAKWISDAQSVLDPVNDSVYVCERETYELLYMSENLRKQMGVTEESCRGKKCYEILMQSTAPCPFCSMAKGKEEQVYTRLFRLPDSDRIFLSRGKNTNRDGRRVHLEIGAEVTEVGDGRSTGEGAGMDETSTKPAVGRV